MVYNIDQKQIADIALAHLGQESLSVYTEDTRNGRAIRKYYDLARQVVLESSKWPFAVKRVVLSPVVGSPAFEWTYTFGLPSDLIKINEVWDTSNSSIEYEREGPNLLCNSDTIRLKYTYNNETIADYTAKFVDAMALKLAAAACYEITGSRTEAQSLEEQFSVKLFEAKSSSDRGTNTLQVVDNSTWAVNG